MTIAPGSRLSVPSRRTVSAIVLATGLALGGIAATAPGRAAADSFYGPTTISFSPTSTLPFSSVLLFGSTTPFAVSSLVPGGIVTLTGSGFAPGESVSLTFGGQTAPFTTVQADGTGSLDASVTIPASMLPGTYTVTAMGAVSDHTATASLTINAIAPALEVSSTTVNAGGTVLVSGVGFTPNQVISFSIPMVTSNGTVTFNGAAAAAPAVTTDAAGTFANVPVTIPASIPPNTTYTLLAQASNGAGAPISITVNNLSLSVNATYTAAGSMVAVSGSGFAANELVNVTLAGQPGVLATLQANASGSVSGSVLLPVSLASGSYTLVATGQVSGDSATAPVVIPGAAAVTPAAAPVLSLSAASVASGGAITVSGSGFAAGELVSLTLTGPIGLATAPVATNTPLAIYGYLGVQTISLGSVQATTTGALPATNETIAS